MLFKKPLHIPLLTLLVFFACTEKPVLKIWESYDETAEIATNADHPIKRMHYKRLISKTADRNLLFKPFEKALPRFSDAQYETLKPFILEQDIPTIQKHIASGNLSYETLTLFYLYRMYRIELDRERYLNALISLNPSVLEEAKAKDVAFQKNPNQPPLFGMPILLKDNLNTQGIATTAGAAAFANNIPEQDAFIVNKLKAAGALILGKVNMSEWAYYFCSGCPVGYSALGGQTLNPYGRKKFESGGSSSGSGVAVAANYAVAAIGSETSGSILSPSGKNAVVGLKPTIGTLSRGGIIPISETLDTAGPMTKFVIDNALLFNAMLGQDTDDTYSFHRQSIDIEALKNASVAGRRVGYFESYKEDSLYQNALEQLKIAGALLIPFDPPKINFSGFRTLLDVDMKKDLPNYINRYANPDLAFEDVASIIAFNAKDTLLYAPYGQALFEGIVADTTHVEDFKKLRKRLQEEAQRYFATAMEANDMEVVLSINNYTAGYAAAAHYPALTVPMGFYPTGEPANLTFIAPSKKEEILFEFAAAFEQMTHHRKPPNF
jgi:amidase